MAGPSPTGGGPAPFPDWDEVLADIGDRIRAERQARGWSQTDLARGAGVDRSTITRLESGDSALLITFAMACQAMNVDMGYLLSADWRMPARNPSLSPTQVQVLAAVADGRPLARAAQDLGTTRNALASVLSNAYQRLGVADIRRGQRRAAAVRVARAYRLIDAA